MSNTIINPYNFTASIVGAWKEVARTTVGSASSTINVASIPNKQYYMILWDAQNSGQLDDINLKLGYSTIDSGSNYADRFSVNGGSDSTGINQGDIRMDANGGDFGRFGVSYISNLSASEKLIMGNRTGQNTSGAGTAPLRFEGVGKWANTSNVMDMLRFTNVGTGNFATGSEVVVLGYDATDVHTDTDNFWQELASITLASPADEMDTGTIPAKKYLWVQAFVNGSGAQDNTSFRFNGDTGNNYAWRNSDDGAADTTVINYNYLRAVQGDEENSFSNTFIVNNSANEKLLTCDTVKYTTAGAGTAPNRNEMAGKWANTSSQITQIKYIQFGAGDMDTGSTLKVWGSD